MSRIDCPTKSRKHLAKLCDIKVVPPRAEWRQIFFREPEQSHRRREPLSMLRMGRMLKVFLQMDKRARRLDQPFEILGVLRRDSLAEPNLFQDIVRFIITLLIPAAEK